MGEDILGFFGIFGGWRRGLPQLYAAPCAGLSDVFASCGEWGLGVKNFGVKRGAGPHFLATVVNANIFLVGDQHELAGLAEERMAPPAFNSPSTKGTKEHQGYEDDVNQPRRGRAATK